MAQSRRFGYFRDRLRRDESSPTSPIFKERFGSAFSLSTSAAEPAQLAAPTRIPTPDRSPVSPLPPVLPPIPRVASSSKPSDKAGSGTLLEDVGLGVTMLELDPKKSTPPRTVRAVQPSSSNYRPDEALVLPPIPRIASSRDDRKDATMPTDTSRQERKSFEKRTTGLRRPNSQGSSNTQSIHEDVFGQSLLPKSAGEQQSFQRPLTPPRRQNESHLSPSAKRESHSLSHGYPPAQSATSPRRLLAEPPSPLPNRSPNSQWKEPSQNKKRRNLLNPMALLLRRRSAVPQEEAVEATLATNRTNLDVPVMRVPEDYDPRIKGKGVHDFSAPRDKRHTSSNESSRPVILDQNSDRRPSTPTNEAINDDEQAPITVVRKSSAKDRVAHISKEVNNEDVTEEDKSAIRRESLANPEFLARMSQHLDAHQSEETLHQNSLTSERPPNIHDNTDDTMKHEERTSLGASSGISTLRSSISHETRATSPPISPQKSLPRTSLEPALQMGRLSSQFSRTGSHASRFSFQMNNDRSAAQERALEEKHKEKARNHAAKARRDSRFDDLYDEDLDDYDDMMDDEGFEERIPGVNADDEDEFSGLGNMELSHPGVRNSASTKANIDPPSTVNASIGTDTAAQAVMSGLGLVQLQDQPANRVPSTQKSLHRQATGYSKMSDDMYFDDGMIESPGTQASNPLDESNWDTSMDDVTQRSTGPRTTLLTKSSSVYTGDTLSPGAMGTRDVSQPFQQMQQSGIVEETKMQDYHQALASAANKAAEAGRFQREGSFSELDDEPNSGSLEDNDATPRKSKAVPSLLPPFGGLDDFEMGNDIGFEDISDDLDDDPMVAAANAEALAADESGWYGTEFGFFGAAGGKTDEAFHGGFLGNSNTGMQNALKEPNLTPITERSEFSTRNSFISVGGYGPPGSASYMSSSMQRDSLAGADLRTLAANMNDQDEDDMSLSQLLKLRRERFGGSRPHSYAASSGSGNHSPSKSASSLPGVKAGNAWGAASQEDVSQFARMQSPGQEDGNYGYGAPRRASSSDMSLAPPSASSITVPAFPHSARDMVLGSNAPARYSPGPSAQPVSPVSLAGAPTAAPASAPPILNAAPMPAPSSSVLRTFNTRPAANAYSNFHHAPAQHRHSGSGERRESFPSADSVTYVRDEPDGEEPRWFLERRRTMETGEVVVVGRQLVEGGRI